jgi:hypothetical protein
MTGATEMTTTIELKFTLRPEELEGGYTRYTTEDLPGFRLLCEPSENPIPLIERAITKFIPAFIAAAMTGKSSIRGLRIIPSSPRDLFKGTPAAILMEADIEHHAA